MKNSFLQYHHSSCDINDSEVTAETVNRYWARTKRLADWDGACHCPDRQARMRLLGRPEGPCRVFARHPTSTRSQPLFSRPRRSLLFLLPAASAPSAPDAAATQPLLTRRQLRQAPRRSPPPRADAPPRAPDACPRRPRGGGHRSGRSEFSFTASSLPSARAPQPFSPRPSCPSRERGESGHARGRYEGPPPDERGPPRRRRRKPVEEGPALGRGMERRRQPAPVAAPASAVRRPPPRRAAAAGRLGPTAGGRRGLPPGGAPMPARGASAAAAAVAAAALGTPPRGAQPERATPARRLRAAGW